ncbi:hypothetical protein HMPREF3182_01372 [Megasphaera hutchinsoni]|uniref:Uncharacterized protein n=1 Tax=Megasphaera hutchinsoni TaxID=1588748 RepID=A0A134CDX2_9FIRM|nr:hypothetical protein HMPREF3182_01372 [Megasphaera hutchinsoni]
MHILNNTGSELLPSREESDVDERCFCRILFLAEVRYYSAYLSCS